MKNFNSKSLLKWVPVVIAAIVAAVQQVNEIKESDRIDSIEQRLDDLEKGEN